MVGQIFTKGIFLMTQFGTYRHLMQSSTPNGHFVVLAIDHRANLLNSLNQHASVPLSDADFSAFKQQVMRHLLPHASAVLTDPEYGIRRGIATGIIHGQMGLLAPLEVTNYDLHPSLRETEFIPDWSVAHIKKMGGTGVKFLLYYNHEAEVAPKKHALVAEIVAQCQQYELPLFLEPIVYSLDVNTPLSNAEKQRLVVQAAKNFSAMGVDILKLEFPLNPDADESTWAAALAEVNAASSVPWTLLSAGVDYPTFCRQTEMACKAGASGVIVGRAVWAEAVTLQGESRDEFLATEAARRIQELGELCAAYGTDWRKKVAAPV